MAAHMIMATQPYIIAIYAVSLSLAACAPPQIGTPAAYLDLNPDCALAKSDGIVTRPAANPIVQNGTAYDCATVRYTALSGIRVPNGTQIIHTMKRGGIKLLISKTLDFWGHPPKPMSPQTARRNMGCAFQLDGDVLVLATFGEWDSHIEGGATVQLFLDLPDELEITTSAALSGEHSVALDAGGRPEQNPDYWYVSGSAAASWESIFSVPADPWTQLPPGW